MVHEERICKIKIQNLLICLIVLFKQTRRTMTLTGMWKYEKSSSRLSKSYNKAKILFLVSFLILLKTNKCSKNSSTLEDNK